MDKNRKLTRDQAVAGQEFHYGECTRTHGPRGGEREDTVTYRRTGATKLWKTRPDEFRVPVQYGMRNSGYGRIDQGNMDTLHLAERCPLLETEYRRVTASGSVIELDKAGGGTLGKRYDGDWTVRLWDPRGNMVAEEKMTTSTPKTHSEASEIAEEILGTTF